MVDADEEDDEFVWWSGGSCGGCGLYVSLLASTISQPGSTVLLLAVKGIGEVANELCVSPRCLVPPPPPPLLFELDGRLLLPFNMGMLLL